MPRRKKQGTPKEESLLQTKLLVSPIKRHVRYCLEFFSKNKRPSSLNKVIEYIYMKQPPHICTLLTMQVTQQKKKKQVGLL
jgi:hypothetical protein